MKNLKDILSPVVEETVGDYFLPEVYNELEKLFILEGLRLCNGNASIACKFIGIHRNSINKKIKQHGIQNERKSFKVKKIM